MKSNEKNKKKRWWLLLIPAVLIAGAAIFLINGRNQAAQAQAELVNQPTYTLETTSLTAEVSATGSVRARQSATLNWQTSGRVNEVKAGLGAKVTQGELLAGLDPASLPASLAQASVDLMNAQKALDDLKSSNTSAAQAQVNLVTAQKAVEDAQTKVTALDYPRASDTTIENAWTNYQLALSNVSRADDMYRQVANLPDDDTRKVNALNALTGAIQKRDSALNTYNWYVGKPTADEAAQTKASLELAKAQLADAQRAYDAVKNGPSAIDLAAAEARVSAAQSTLDSVKISAPFNGVVTSLNVQMGDLVNNGTAAFRIDDLSTLYVDVQVSEVDINRVQAGQPVKLVFDAMPDKTYTGAVESVDLAGSSSSGSVTYKVTVKMSDADASVRPGMTASANIEVSRLEGVLAVPSQSLATLNNNEVVYLVSNSSVRPVRVTTGMASDSMTQVESNQLKAGDKILLTPPTNLSALRSNFGLFGGLLGGGPRAGEFNGSGNFNRSGQGNSNSSGGNTPPLP